MSLLILFGAGAAPPVVAGKTLAWIKINGQWKVAKPYIKEAGIWEISDPFVKVNGNWK